ncbi:MAG: hypothetical protein M2R45_00632 [Verrucomicrobia subdivision 3 bacterium]|nr:hypothetical protein [Limisphaerales bacterium]MCS1414485.1 hypothetical protein [Limisphaerales bacterium]
MKRRISDRLAAQDARFTQAYMASPMCSPTRAPLLPGKSPARLNMPIRREAALNRGNRRLLELPCPRFVALPLAGDNARRSPSKID